jgi:hypothetical protein
MTRLQNIHENVQLPRLNKSIWGFYLIYIIIRKLTDLSWALAMIVTTNEILDLIVLDKYIKKPTKW